MEARGKDDFKLQPLEMTAQAFVFFFAGFETTSSQICLVAHMMAIHPEMQERLQREIDEVLAKLGPNEKVTYAVINAMPYLDAVFNETLRRFAPAPFLDRVCAKEYKLPPAKPGLEPYTVQAGDIIWIPVSGVHMDEKYYKDADKFDPDRFMDKRVTINDTKFLGFGIGPRSCIGNRFAMLETKTLIFHLLAKYNFRKSSRTCDPWEFSTDKVVIWPKGGFWLSFEKRNNAGANGQIWVQLHRETIVPYLCSHL